MESPAGGPPRPLRFERRFQIEAADIDTLGHVNNVVYLRWVQEIATAHWRAAAPATLQAEVVWVVLRHEIDYERPALPGDEVIARTWVGGATGTRFERFVDVLRAQDGATLARARTIWCPVNARTGRPRRLDPSLHEFFSEPPSA
jgi:acyl-CoA thioester hydrolase